MSDIHTRDCGWGPTTFPYVGGHEVIGTVAAVGNKVTCVKVGQRVGVGPQCASCGVCDVCKRNADHLCPQRVFTYNAKDQHGRQTYGGYADGIVCQDRFAVPIPDALDTEHAAPLLCAGVTVFSPLNRFTKRFGTGKDVAVIAIGGLGHLAIMFAKALGHNVTAVSRGTDKKDLCHKLGATGYVNSADKDEHAAAAMKFDYVLDTSAFDGEISGRIHLTKFGGILCLVGLPDVPFTFNGMLLIAFERTIESSLIGSPADTKAMLEFVEKNKLQCMVSEVAPLTDVNRVHKDVLAGKPRFRVVLKNDL
jgi:D-arabinose 1-dehydrogenase-like Zn-dependent alcohol dehydrogenase